MSDQPPIADRPAASPPPNPASNNWLGGSAKALAGAAGRAASSFGNWLASIGWGKFLLLALLLLIAAGLVESVFGPSHRHGLDDQVPVAVNVTVDSDGLHIGPVPGGRTEQVPPKVRIDDRGVRIEADKNGRKATVVIDRNGVRVEETPPDTSVPERADSTVKPGVVTVPPGMINDPEKVAKAVEAAKDQIEQIVQEQVDRKVAGLPQLGASDPMTWPDVAGLVALLLFVAMIVKIAMGSKRRAESRAQVADAVAADEGLKRQLAEARLKTMQAQVEPHFLFNTLASVDYLIETDPPRASRMQKNLIQYLRSALPQMRQASSTLGQEMALCRSYLEILKVRMDDRLQFAIVMPAGLSSAAFPPMMLQTLVENAIKHGLEPKPEGGSLTLSADVVDGSLRVAVSDTGLGFGAAGAPGSGVGLNNVRERLQALFGSRAKLTIEPNSPNGTIVTVQVPYAVGLAEAAPQVSPQPA